MEKLKITLTPYAAVCIYKFLSKFEDDFKREPLFASFKECYEEYGHEVLRKITKQQLEDAVIQTKVNQLIDRDPPCKA